MADKPWKKMERDIARIFHTTRRLMKGTDAVSDIGDENFPLVVDCKKRKKQSWEITSWFKKIERAALEKGKWPVLVLQEPGKQRKYAIVRRGPLVKLILKKTGIDANVFHVVEKTGNRFSVLSEWQLSMKKLSKLRSKSKHDLHLILCVKNEKADLDLAILKPEVLSWIFVEGGVIDAGHTSEGQE